MIINLSTLLPYDLTLVTPVALKNGLKGYSFLLEALDQTATSLQNKELPKFDAIVGERLCQIRAIKLIKIFSSIFSTLDSLMEQISLIKRQMSAIKPLPQISFEQLLKDHNLEIALTSDQMFALQAYILTYIKQPVESTKKTAALLDGVEESKLEKLKELGDVTGKFSLNLVKELRMQLSAASVSFIQEQSSIFNMYQEFEHLKSKDCVVTYRDCQCLPFFCVNDVLVQTMLRDRIPLVVKIVRMAQDRDHEKIGEKQAFFFDALDGRKYHLSSPSEQDIYRLAFVVEGVMCRHFENLPDDKALAEELSKHDFLDIFFANSALHTQYPDSSKNELVSSEKFMMYKRNDRQLGCSIEDPSLLLINHVFCDTVSKALEVG